jgi:hypothetical protein
MGILIPRPKLEAGEEVRWNVLANHVDGPSYVLWGMKSAAGGRLYVTDRRVLFQVGRLDAPFGAKRWEQPLDAVTSVDVVDRDEEIFAGGLRKRLGLGTADGIEVFVVNGLDEKIIELRALFPRA